MNPKGRIRAKAHVTLPCFNSKRSKSLVGSPHREHPIVAIECDTGEIKPKNLVGFEHPQRAIYLLGAEDGGIDLDILRKIKKNRGHVVKIESRDCMNVAVTGSIVIYDRILKIKQNG